MSRAKQALRTLRFPLDSLTAFARSGSLRSIYDSTNRRFVERLDDSCATWTRRGDAVPESFANFALHKVISTSRLFCTASNRNIARRRKSSMPARAHSRAL